MDFLEKKHRVPEVVLESLSPTSQAAISRLQDHLPEPFDLSSYASKKLAAVLVLLYEKDDCLQVLLTTRSKLLRSHPGQTALPGGKCDDTDKDMIDTAFREANEEVGLPRESSAIHILCILQPQLSKYGLLVTPVVAFLSDVGLLNSLTPCEGEVDAIFEHPLRALLDPSLSLTLPLSKKGSEDWPYDDDVYNTSDSLVFGSMLYRMHRFRTTASPIKGLTSDILIMTAVIAYEQQPFYDRWAPKQPNSFSELARVLTNYESKHKAADVESKHTSREHLPSI